MLNTFARCAAVLWVNDYKYLAGVLLSSIDDSDQGMYTHTPRLRKAPEDITARMEDLFPFRRKLSKRAKSTHVNPGELAINQLTEMIKDLVFWTSITDEKLLNEIPSAMGRRLYSPPDIRTNITSLLFDSIENKL
jgi:hypothetical protein